MITVVKFFAVFLHFFENLFASLPSVFIFVVRGVVSGAGPSIPYLSAYVFTRASIPVYCCKSFGYAVCKICRASWIVPSI